MRASPDSSGNGSENARQSRLGSQPAHRQECLASDGPGSCTHRVMKSTAKKAACTDSIRRTLSSSEG